MTRNKLKKNLRAMVSSYHQLIYIEQQLGDRNEGVEMGIIRFCPEGIRNVNWWLFGLLDRSTKKRRVFVMQDKFQETLINMSNRMLMLTKEP